MTAKQSAYLLHTSPHESLRILQSAVLQHPNWCLQTGGTDDTRRFVIEKKVRYDLIRGWPMHAVYQVIGSFQETENSKTVLRYAVSGQSAIPLLHTAFNLGWLLVITVLLAGLVFSPMINGNWIGVLLLGVLILMMIGYSVYAYRSYQGHLSELTRFMEAYVQQTNRQALWHVSPSQDAQRHF